MKKTIFRRLFLGFVGVLLGIVAVELVFRTLDPQKTHERISKYTFGCYAPDPDVFATLTPNSRCEFATDEYRMHINVNNLGFRSDETTSIEKKDGSKRILIIGDSFTFGQGVEASESYPSIVQKILTQKGISVETINAGMVGTELGWDYLRLKKILPKLKPDIVVVGFFLGNDLSDQLLYDWKLDEKGLPKKIDSNAEFIDSSGIRLPISTPLRYQIPILRNSHIFMYVAERLFGTFNQVQAGDFNDYSFCLVQKECHLLDNQIQTAKQLLVAMNDEVKTAKGEFYVILIPWIWQLPRDVLVQSGLTPLVALKEDRQYLVKLFENFLNENNIKSINVLSDFESYKGEKPVLYKVDRHFTAQGNQLVAESVSNKLKEILK